MNEADERFAERLAEDLERYLGPDIVLEDLDLGPASGSARIQATCAFEGRTEVLDVCGATRLEAYNELIVRAAELRLLVAVRRVNDDAVIGLAAAFAAGRSHEQG